MAEDFVLAAVGAFVLDAFAAAFLASLDDWAPANRGTNRAIANAIPMAAGERTKRLRMWPPRRVVSRFVLRPVIRPPMRGARPAARKTVKHAPSRLGIER